MFKARCSLKKAGDFLDVNLALQQVSVEKRSKRLRTVHRYLQIPISTFVLRIYITIARF